MLLNIVLNISLIFFHCSKRIIFEVCGVFFCCCCFVVVVFKKVLLLCGGCKLYLSFLTSNMENTLRLSILHIYVFGILGV